MQNDVRTSRGFPQMIFSQKICEEQWLKSGWWNFPQKPDSKVNPFENSYSATLPAPSWKILKASSQYVQTPEI